ncbi:MAG: phage repressor protein CI [Hafnia sp.]
MFSETQNGKAILERVIEAYGVTTKKELAEKLETSPSSVSSWALRDTVPGDIIIKCAMETHRSLHWLMTGKEEFEKSNSYDVEELPRFEAKDPVQLKGQALYEQVLSSGGKAILERIMQAYGFTKQKELADLLGISTATISTWIRREYFPGDVVVACALDTGVPLGWLAIGSDLSKSIGLTTALQIPRYCIVGGKLLDSGDFLLDPSLLSSVRVDGKLSIVFKNNEWFVIVETAKFYNGVWILDIDGVVDVFNVIKMPDDMLQVRNENGNFICHEKTINIIGVSVLSIK